MGNTENKIRKKEAKAKVKLAKAEIKRSQDLSERVKINITQRNDGSELIVSGLREDQLSRLLPHVQKEVAIELTSEHNAFKAGLMRFIREGVFQTLIKVITGLIVGYLLIRLGIR